MTVTSDVLTPSNFRGTIGEPGNCGCQGALLVQPASLGLIWIGVGNAAALSQSIYGIVAARSCFVQALEFK